MRAGRKAVRANKGSVSFSLGQLADCLGATLYGDAEGRILRIASLARAGPGDLSFLSDPRYRKYLRGTRASAVILSHRDLADCPVAALVLDTPLVGFARAAALLEPPANMPQGIHPTASVNPRAKIDQTAWIGPHAVVEAGVCVATDVFVGPCCIVREGVMLGEGTRLTAHVTVCAGARIGKHVLIHPGAVIGADGFGFVRDGTRWIKMPQRGSVRVGDEVEIGANTTIDRGALEDTVIEDGVKLDNQVQVGHNVHIGTHTAIAGCVGIAGSVRIGRRCLIQAAVTIADHLEVVDDVQLMATAVVVKSITKPGVYSSVLPVEENQTWLRNLVRIRRLDNLASRVRTLEHRLSPTLTAGGINIPVDRAGPSEETG